LRLQDGDAISVQGTLKAELYDKDGEKRLSLSIVDGRSRVEYDGMASAPLSARLASQK
jgi:hypothetical protein